MIFLSGGSWLLARVYATDFFQLIFMHFRAFVQKFKQNLREKGMRGMLGLGQTSWPLDGLNELFNPGSIMYEQPS